MRIHREIEVKRPIQEVFDYVADPRNELEWHPRVRSMEKTSDGPVEAGATFRGDYRGSGPMDFALVEHDRPGHLRFLGENGRLSIDAVIDFQAVDGRTRGAFDLSMRSRGAFRLVLPLLAPMIRRQYAQVMPSLARALAARS